jgi:iron complex transport system substrate-binding protein
LRVLSSALLAAALQLLPAAASDTAPSRIVSLNLCTDEILIDLVPRERIRALSHLAADPLVSAVADKARGIPWTYGEAEVVLGFDPDLVIVGEFTTPATVALLERLGIKLLKVPLASDIAGMRSVTYQIGDAVGARERADALIAAFDRRIAAAAPITPWRPTAVVYQVNSSAASPGSIADAVLQAAGFSNLAGVLGLGSGGQLPLEELVARPPDLIVLSGPVDEYHTPVADNLRHPALTALLRTHRSVVLPWRLWLCATPYLADAIERLAAVRADMEQNRPVR